MRTLAKIISTGLGIGYVRKGAGTLAALVTCLFWYMAGQRANLFFAVIVITVLFIAGVWSASMVEKEWGEDNNRVVIDEIFGMCVGLFLLPVKWSYIIPAFLLFRFFDIIKPLFIRKAEALPSGWGVMTDDLLAGIYSNLLLQWVVKINLW
jgi:phosphatidylglycerophosphatase A